MSQSFKTAFKFWFWFILGIALNLFQAYKYFTNTLEYTIGEVIILLVGLMFMIRPTAIPDLILKTFGKK